MTVRSEVISQFMKVAQEQQRNLPPLTDNMPLLETGLDSLCFAIMVTRLEDSLGVDPFTTDNSLFPITLGEFVRLYEGSEEQPMLPSPAQTKEQATLGQNCEQHGKENV